MLEPGAAEFRDKWCDSHHLALWVMCREGTKPALCLLVIVFPSLFPTAITTSWLHLPMYLLKLVGGGKITAVSHIWHGAPSEQLKCCILYH